MDGCRQLRLCVHELPAHELRDPTCHKHKNKTCFKDTSHALEWPCEWDSGDVIGIAANVDLGKIAVSKNGDWTGAACGVVFDDPNIQSGVFPCFSGNNHTVRYALAAADFKYAAPAGEMWRCTPPPPCRRASPTGKARHATIEGGQSGSRLPLMVMKNLHNCTHTRSQTRYNTYYSSSSSLLSDLQSSIDCQ